MSCIQGPAIDEHTKREKLKATRNLLFERFLKTPHDVCLALEIKLYDDRVEAAHTHLSHEPWSREGLLELFATQHALVDRRIRLTSAHAIRQRAGDES